MKKEFLAISLVTAMLLAGCGKVEENSSAADPTKGQGANAVGQITGDEDITYIDSLLSVDHSLDVTFMGENQTPDVEAMEEAASIILETIAKPGTEDRIEARMLCDVPRDESFLIELKFNEEVGIQVGNESITGSRISIIKTGDDEYYFGIDKKDEQGLYSALSFGAATSFDSFDMLRVLETIGLVTYDIGEPEPDRIISNINYVDYYNNGQQDVYDKQNDMVRILLEGISNTNVHDNAVDTNVYCMDLEAAKREGFLMQVSLCTDMDITSADTTLNGNFITLIKDDNSYYFEIDEMDLQTMSVTKTGSAIYIDRSYAEQIIEIAGGEVRNNDEVLTPENIENYMFGFELYNDGHKDCWANRYACAKLMLEAIAQPGTDLKGVDLTITAEQHNAMENDGFMTWLKFDDVMNFKVGDRVLSGRAMEIIKLNDSYYFYVGEMFEDYEMFEFDSSYIERILAASQGGVITGSLEDPDKDTEDKADFYRDLDLNSTNMIIRTSDKEYSTADGNTDYISISEEQKHDIVMLILDRLSDTYSKSNISYLHEDEALSDPSGMYLLFDFGQPTDVLVSNLRQEDIYVISLAGNARNGFDIQVNNADVYKFDDDIADRIREILEG